MRKRVAGLLAILGLLLVQACSDKTSVPLGILSIDKMTPILWDMVEADQYAAMLIKDSAHVDPKLERLRLYEQVFRSHDISREKFEKSYKYYKEHPEINQILYDSLAAQGSRYRTEAYAHPSVRPVVTPVIPPPVTKPVTPPAGRTTPVTHPAANPLFHPPGRPGMPLFPPVKKPDTSHRKAHPHTPAPPQKTPAGHSSSIPPAKTPVP
jgi:hypothetical protein